MLIMFSYITGVNCTKENEMLVVTGACPPERTCLTRLIQYLCIADQTVHEECRCKSGYVRISGHCFLENLCKIFPYFVYVKL